MNMSTYSYDYRPKPEFSVGTQEPTPMVTVPLSTYQELVRLSGKHLRMVCERDNLLRSLLGILNLELVRGLAKDLDINLDDILKKS